jgi:hypothetical protein
MSTKRVIVICDHAALSRAISINLHGAVDMEVVAEVNSVGDKTTVSPGGPGPAQTNLDLIVVAACKPGSEPLVLLQKASLMDHIGRTPLLIISDRPVEFAPEYRIAHLPFPFLATELDHQVYKLLAAA